MSRLAPLLEIQELDVAAVAARTRSDELPERARLPELAQAIAALEAEAQTTAGERQALETTEEELGRAVAAMAADIEAAELERYSGKRKDRDAALAHDAAQEERRAKKAALEEQEMEVLEGIEGLEERVAELAQRRSAQQAEGEAITATIAAVEAEVASDLERLAAQRLELEPSVPKPVLAAYDRVRARPGAGVQGATRLVKGSCEGCRIKLPSLVNRQMLDEPEDALIQCPQCRRVLVR